MRHSVEEINAITLLGPDKLYAYGKYGIKDFNEIVKIMYSLPYDYKLTITDTIDSELLDQMKDTQARSEKKKAKFQQIRDRLNGKLPTEPIMSKFEFGVNYRATRIILYLMDKIIENPNFAKNPHSTENMLLVALTVAQDFFSLTKLGTFPNLVQEAAKRVWAERYGPEHVRNLEQVFRKINW